HRAGRTLQGVPPGRALGQPAQHPFAGADAEGVRPFSGKKTPQPYTTYYQVFVGEGTAFEGTTGVSPRGLPDLILVTEAGEAVPWTKPEDLAYDPEGPLPPLGGVFEGSLPVVFADGSVQEYRKEELAREQFRHHITFTGRER